jgi:hypothetical protein
MKKQVLVAGLAALICGSTVVWSDQNGAAFNAGVKAAQQDAQFIAGVQAGAATADGATADEERKLAMLMKSPGGVKSELNPDGTVVRVPLPTSMKKASAKSFARNQADLGSKEALVEWMSTSVAVDKAGNVLQMTQDKGSDATNTVTQESAEERGFGKCSKSQAQGLVKGIQGLTEAIEDDEYIGIFGWSPKSANAATNAQALNSGQAPAAAPAGAGQPSRVPAAPGIPSIPNKKGNAAGLNDF